MKKKKSKMRGLNLNNEIYFADFETLTKDNKQFKELLHTKVYLWGFSKIDEKEIIFGNSLDDFMNLIFENKKSKIIYFHNLTFDGNFIFKWLLKNYKDWYVDEFNNKNKKFNYWKIFRKNKKIYYIHFKKRVRDGFKIKDINIKFQCTFNLLNASVASLTKDFSNREKHFKKDLEKLKKYGVENENDFYNFGDDDIFKNQEILKIYVDYLKNDIVTIKNSYIGLKNSIENMDESFNKKYKKRSVNIKNILTAASVSKKLFKNHILNNKILSLKELTVSKEIYELSFNFLSGGFVQFNKKYQNTFLEKGLSIDINSSYPWSMTNLLPYGGMLLSPPKSGDYLTYCKVFIEYKIKKENKNIPFIKDLTKNGRYSTKGSGLYYLLYDEFLLWQKYYNIKIVAIEFFYFKAKKYLKNYIEKLYLMKANAQNEGEKLCAKLLCNSLYGSFAKKSIYESQFLIPKNYYELLKKQKRESNSKEILINDKWKVETFKQEYWKELDGCFIGAFDIEREKNIKNWSNLFIGSTITAYSRIYLIETIAKIGFENFIYCDTDSIFFKWNKTIKELQKIIKIDKKELGAWKVEFEFIKGKILGPKRYVFENQDGKIKYASAGIKKLKFSTFEQIEHLLNSGVEVENARYQIVEDSYGIYFDFKNLVLNSGKN